MKELSIEHSKCIRPQIVFFLLSLAERCIKPLEVNNTHSRNTKETALSEQSLSYKNPKITQLLYSQHSGINPSLAFLKAGQLLCQSKLLIDTAQ